MTNNNLWRKEAIIVMQLAESLSIETEEDKQLWKDIHDQNVLVIYDIATSGATLNEVLRTLRIINNSNNITIFSLIGRQDLMAESM